MSLIKCPECGKEISDAADACPGCGHPLGVFRYMRHWWIFLIPNDSMLLAALLAPVALVVGITAWLIARKRLLWGVVFLLASSVFGLAISWWSLMSGGTLMGAAPFMLVGFALCAFSAPFVWAYFYLAKEAPNLGEKSDSNIDEKKERLPLEGKP